MERPDIKDSIGDIGLSEANKIYTDSPKLFKHIQRLDSYIDYLEEKLESQKPETSDEALLIADVVLSEERAELPPNKYICCGRLIGSGHTWKCLLGVGGN
jgi:hypothetical protein